MLTLTVVKTAFLSNFYSFSLSSFHFSHAFVFLCRFVLNVHSSFGLKSSDWVWGLKGQSQSPNMTIYGKKYHFRGLPQGSAGRGVQSSMSCHIVSNILNTAGKVLASLASSLSLY